MKDNNINSISLEAAALVNPIPNSVNWEEIDTFLIENRFGCIVGNKFWFKSDWEHSSIIIDYRLSQTSINVLKCLDKDTSYFYDIVINGKSINNFNGDSISLKDFLKFKYVGLSEELTSRMENYFLYNCR